MEKKRIRLDKYISEATGASRSKVKQWLKQGRITVGDQKVTDPGFKVSGTKESAVGVSGENYGVRLDGVLLNHSKYHYLMLHKPAGVVSARTDGRDKTVLDLVLEQDWGDAADFATVYRKVSPVGRLDKDTEGLLLLTDDGELSHRLLSPKKHVDKIYFALLDNPMGEKEMQWFQEGMDIGDEKPTLPAQIRPATMEEMAKNRPEDKEGFGVYITIREGRYHQIKRMVHKTGRDLIYLKRVSMGSLTLDPGLKPGQCRPLTREELEELISDAKFSSLRCGSGDQNSNEEQTCVRD